MQEGRQIQFNGVLIGTHVPVVELVHGLIESAYKKRASDIHILPEQESVRVRFRVDGVLHDAFRFSKSQQLEVITRIKILSHLRTDEHQAAQDGRFKIALEGNRQVDVRVSIIPTHYGESAVLRILGDQAGHLTLQALGFSEKSCSEILRALAKPYGMVLVTGPTGSGKTTTLYTLIKLLNLPSASIITIEDPIEYSISGIEQIQVNPRTGLTFSGGLRSILRQDPNIIMVGEIRDGETAGIAINTALTGHLLLSTLHTNDAATTLPRLLDLGIQAYLIASTVSVAIGQRLIRTICQNCKVAQGMSGPEMESLIGVIDEELLLQEHLFYKGQGCENCNMSGYRGRIGIHEVLVLDPEIREAILLKAPAAEIKKIAVKNGMTTMIQDGFLKAAQGLTTIEEVLRMLYE